MSDVISQEKDFMSRLSQITDEINKKIDEISLVKEAPYSVVYEAMRYSLMAGGKRIRPVITVAVSDMLGGNRKDAVISGIALECIHTYSLIHDDLPCMDNDDLRRGKPTCHKVYPENIALLAGDALLNKAFEILSDRENFKTLSDSDMLNLINCLSKSSSASGMIGGQVIDIESEKKDKIDITELELMHKLKTSALISGAAELGCIVGGKFCQNNKEYSKILEFSLNLGLAFQIKDDILDVIGDESILGKPIGSDGDSGKNTFVTLLGIDESEKLLNKHTDIAISALDCFGEKAWFLKELALLLLSREK